MAKIKNKIEVVKKIHVGWKKNQCLLSHQSKYNPEFLKTMLNLFGKYQYFISSKKGKISIVYLDYGDIYDKPFYEMYCLEGNLFIDVERFDSLEKAMKKAKRYLE